MTLLDELAAEATIKGPSCTTTLTLEAMEPDDRADMLEALASGYTAAALSRVLKRRGISLAPQSIARHRRGECKCPSNPS